MKGRPIYDLRDNARYSYMQHIAARFMISFPRAFALCEDSNNVSHTEYKVIYDTTRAFACR
jgi:hypothetical protein